MASMGLNLEEQKAVDRFRANVVEPSMHSLVILDFWAEWCGPCKALTPVLEKVAADYADKGVVLAKVNVDEEGFIAIKSRLKRLAKISGEMISLDTIEKLVEECFNNSNFAAVNLPDKRKGEKIII